MSDLPSRLRELHHNFGHGHDVLIEAADRIEFLEAALTRLTAAHSGLRALYRAAWRRLR